MDGQASSRRSLSSSSASSARKKPPPMDIRGLESSSLIRRSSSSISLASLGGERTVKRLRLSKALTVPENTTVHEVCRRMANRRVDAVLLTDSNALLCGILTDRDIAARVIAREMKLEETPASKVMTRNPVFVLSDTSAVEALQKMVQGKFRHLPVVENGEVIALLDIAKCLYDAIARMERAAEKGKAIAAAVEGVEKHWGTSVSGSNTFVETIRERMFRPSLSTIISENPKVVTLPPTETVLNATKKMLELQTSSAVVMDGNKAHGIITSRDILMRLVAKGLSPDSTPVEKVMTPNPECSSVDTSILEALHIMHDGKFLHLPVMDREGKIVSIVDVLHITHAAIATVENSGGAGNESTASLMQKFWDSALAVGPLEEEDDARSEGSMKAASEPVDIGRSPAYSSLAQATTTFGFKLEDRRGRLHRFNCDIRSLTYVITSVLQRVGADIDRNRLPQILYDDEDRDKVVLASDLDLTAAVDHARLAGWTSLRLYLDYATSSAGAHRKGVRRSRSLELTEKEAWNASYGTVAAGAALVAGIGVVAYLKRSGTIG